MSLPSSATDRKLADAETALAALERADISIGVELSHHRRDPLVRVAAEVGKLGDQGPLYAAAALMFVGGLTIENERLTRAGASVGTAVALADLGKRGVKRLLRRTRPHVLLEEERYERDAGGSKHKEEQSFPSGHMAGTVAAARALGRTYSRTAPWTLVSCGVIAGARIAKGAHWPLDVAAGAIVGFVAELLSNVLLGRLFRQR